MSTLYYCLSFLLGKLALCEVAAMFDGSMLMQLKKECGGLQTLLRNQHQVFQGGLHSTCVCVVLCVCGVYVYVCGVCMCFCGLLWVCMYNRLTMFTFNKHLWILWLYLRESLVCVCIYQLFRTTEY